MWCVDRLTGDDWLSIAGFSTRAAAEVVARAWQDADPDGSYRACLYGGPPADLWLPDQPERPEAVTRAVEAVRAELAAYLGGRIAPPT